MTWAASPAPVVRSRILALGACPASLPAECPRALSFAEEALSQRKSDARVVPRTSPSLQANSTLDQARQKLARVDLTRGLDVSNAAAAVHTCPKSQGALASAARLGAHWDSPVERRSQVLQQMRGRPAPPRSALLLGCGAAASA
jgi:hypothetical protein